MASAIGASGATRQGCLWGGFSLRVIACKSAMILSFTAILPASWVCHSSVFVCASGMAVTAVATPVI